MENVKKFLLAPDESKDDFWESDFLIWGTGEISMTLLSNISMINFLMKIKFSSSVWK